MKKFSIRVQKFGGSSLADPQKLRAVAGFIKSGLQKEEKLCIVVSAMGKTTDDLLALSRQVADDPQPRELDMLISCGERSSMALLAMALSHMGVKAMSLTGSQSGIITDDNHRAAEILTIRPVRIFEAFTQVDVVIVAGFQGVSEKKEVTTLKRGGSDTTAVALAKALKAASLEIYSDVPGVLTADPRLANEAITIPKITFAHMTDMALYGAKVLSYEAAKLAEEHEIPTVLGKTLDNNISTYLSGETIKKTINPVLAITHVINIAKIKINKEMLFNISYPILLLEDDGKDTYVYTHTVESALSLITIHLNRNDYLGNIFKIIKQQNLSYENILASNRQIYIIISEKKVKDAIDILHKSFFLEENR